MVSTFFAKSSSLEYSTFSTKLLNFSLEVSAKSLDASSMMSCLLNWPTSFFSSTDFSISSLSFFSKSSILEAWSSRTSYFSSGTSM
jgi:hypothetical protein